MATSSGSEGAENHCMVENDVNLPSCTSAFNALRFCYSPMNQMKKYYSEGTYNHCDTHRCLHEVGKPATEVMAMKRAKGTSDNAAMAYEEERSSSRTTLALRQTQQNQQKSSFKK